MPVFNPVIALSVIILLTVAACAGMKIEPADDQWDRPQEAMPGIVSGDKGEFTISTGHSALAIGQERPPEREASYAEFRQWQAWQKARHEHSSDYLEFLQWLEFQQAKENSTSSKQFKP